MKKNQTNLEIVSRRENFTVKTIVKGNTVILAYDIEKGKIESVAFALQRGTSGSIDFTGENAFGGGVHKEDFRIDYNYKFQMGDGAIYDEIYAICQEIMNPTTETENAESV
ncbi:hypothetical protein CAPN004_10500 [Capnocytophaga cynodegmi]|uniref:hypothetical protein n=1 Tax=Capnocytophaga cynodegmi TaxID=28189 RepID=UPI001ACC1E4A|nr:hypothetical protein [Capnocytophaga cynodegmi]GIM52020.1 hypothetical protein CAPN004_10500 [Capnocytophaga cynodegmi]